VNPFGDPRKLMKQVQEMQERMQQEIAALRIEATSGGGMVKVVMTGEKKVEALTIDPEVVNKDDVGMLQDLILAAIHEATNKVEAELKDKIGALTGGMKIPGLF
jgi:DNA-binding YbaB/EbfC family protein